jgi:hypothetical protein
MEGRRGCDGEELPNELYGRSQSTRESSLLYICGKSLSLLSHRIVECRTFLNSDIAIGLVYIDRPFENLSNAAAVLQELTFSQ